MQKTLPCSFRLLNGVVLVISRFWGGAGGAALLGGVPGNLVPASFSGVQGIRGFCGSQNTRDLQGKGPAAGDNICWRKGLFERCWLLISLEADEAGWPHAYCIQGSAWNPVWGPGTEHLPQSRRDPKDS